MMYCCQHLLVVISLYCYPNFLYLLQDSNQAILIILPGRLHDFSPLRSPIKDVEWKEESKHEIYMTNDEFLYVTILFSSRTLFGNICQSIFV